MNHFQSSRKSCVLLLLAVCLSGTAAESASHANEQQQLLVPQRKVTIVIDDFGKEPDFHPVQVFFAIMNEKYRSYVPRTFLASINLCKEVKNDVNILVENE